MNEVSVRRSAKFTDVDEWLQYRETPSIYLRNKIAEKNYGLVRSTFWGYRFAIPPWLHEDAMQEGYIGLLKAVEKYDYTRGGFPSYATIGIRREIGRYVDDSALPIRIPAYRLISIRQFARHEEAFRQEYHREPSLEDMARYCDMPLSVVLEINRSRQISCVGDINEELDVSEGGEEASALEELLADNNAENPLEALLNKPLFNPPYGVTPEDLSKTLLRLQPRYYEILTMRALGETREDIGMLYSITPARVRQIEEGAIRQVRGRFGFKWMREIEFVLAPSSRSS